MSGVLTFPSCDGIFFYATPEFALDLRSLKFFNGPIRKSSESKKAYAKRRKNDLKKAKRVCDKYGICYKRQVKKQ